MKTLSIALNTYKESLRNKFLYAALFLVILVFCVAVFLGSVSIGSRKDVIIDFATFTLSFFCSILTILNGVTLLSKEIKHKTIYNILSKPVARSQFIIGKFLGLVFCSTVLILLISVAVFFIIYFLENEVYLNIFLASLFSIMEITVVSAIVIFFSSFSSSPFLPGFFSFSLYLAGRSLNYLLVMIASTDLGASERLLKTIFWTLPDLSLFNISNYLIYNIEISFEQIVQSALYAACYSLILLIFSCYIFKRKDL